MEAGLAALLLTPLGLGLIGSIEPCSIGSTLVLLKFLEGRPWRAKLAHVAAFTGTRALLVGALGVAAAELGQRFADFQRGGWLLLGSAYVVLGLLLAAGRAGSLMVVIGPRWQSLVHHRGSALLGLLFGLNVPACAAPLLGALLAGAAAAAAPSWTAFVALAVFGFALSVPVIVLVLVPGTSRWIDRLTRVSDRLPVLAGVVLVALGVWSIVFALRVAADALVPP